MLNDQQDDDTEYEDFSCVLSTSLSPQKHLQQTTLTAVARPSSSYDGNRPTNRDLTFPTVASDLCKSNSVKSTSAQERHGHSRCIIHIDIDCFYAQAEMIRDPSLREVPLGVQQKYLVVTCNYLARARGVKKLMSIKEAIKICPELVLVKGEDLFHYRTFSETIHSFMTRFTGAVERLGLDENFLDVTDVVNQIMSGNAKDDQGSCYDHSDILPGYFYRENEKDISIKKLEQDMESKGIEICQCGCHTRLMYGAKLAQKIRKELYDNIGFTSCAGVAHNKILAKLMGEQHKPNQQTTIFPDFASEYLNALEIKKIPGIGYTYSKVLATLGVNMVEHLHTVPMVLLEKHFGCKIASFMLEIAQGVDNSEVEKSGDAKSVSEEESFRELTTVEQASKEIRILIVKLLRRLKLRSDAPNTIRLTVRKRKEGKNLRMRESKQEPFSPAILKIENEEEQLEILFQLAFSLFKKVVDTSNKFDLSLINLCFTNFKCVNSSAKSVSVSSYMKTNVARLSESGHNKKQVQTSRTLGADTSSNPTEFSNDHVGGLGAKTNTASADLSRSVQFSNANIEPIDPSVNSVSLDKVHASITYDKSGLPERSRPVATYSKPGKCLQNGSVGPTITPFNGNVPDDVDQEVFSALPSDVKQQLLIEWSFRKRMLSPDMDSTQQSSSQAKRRLSSPSATNSKKKKKTINSNDKKQRDISTFFSR